MRATRGNHLEAKKNAAKRSHNARGVVFSGIGSDGTRGLRAIREQGGTTDHSDFDPRIRGVRLSRKT